MRNLKHLIQLFSTVMFLTSAATSNAGVSFVDIGTGAPPANLFSYVMQPFSTAAQAAVVNNSFVTSIPGNPLSGALTLSIAMQKRTTPGVGWGTWSHGYTGPVFVLTSGTSQTLTLPAGSGAFYAYLEPNNFGTFTIQATTNSGATSGPISVTGSSGAKGFGFYADAGDSISTITFTSPAAASGFALAEFAISLALASPDPIPTLNEWCMIFMASLMALLAIRHTRRQ